MSDKDPQYPNENYPWPHHPAYGHPHDQQAHQHMPPPPAGYYPPPPPPPGYHPHYGYHPYYAHPAYQQAPPEAHQHHGKAHYEQPENDALYQQAQGVVEGLMGEQAGMFKEMLGKMGIDDKEFWKGAMIGAAAALLLGNENVRNNLLQMFTGAGDMLKSGGEKVKESAYQTGSSIKESAYKAGASVKQSATTGNEIFKDTINAGKQGFQASVERHQNEEVTPDEQAAEISSVETDANLTAESDQNEK